MMKMNIWTWIGIGGGIAGLLIGVLSVLMTSTDSTGIYIAAGMLLVFGGMFFLFYKLFFGPMINTARLQKTGIPGKAVILEVKDTGVTINNSPQVKLVLEVKNSFGQKYTTTARVLVSRINPFAYQPGMEVPVKIDPKNEKNVVLDFSGGGSAGAGSASNGGYTQADLDKLKGELEQLQKDNDAILASGRSARAIIKKYTWLGANVNGNNPYVELELEVLPEAAASFSGTARGVIGEVSVPKFQPGKTVYVKYDLYDNSKVTIERSGD
jgi:hypothetical protein